MNDPERRAYMKQLACSIHTWPILGCERCFDRLLTQLGEDQDAFRWIHDHTQHTGSRDRAAEMLAR